MTIPMHALESPIEAAQKEMLFAFKRVLDYECNMLRYWIGQCPPDSQIRNIYKGQFNGLVLLRERMLSPGFVLQFLDANKFDMPEATERIFS